HAIVVAVEPMVFDHHILALDVTGFVQPLRNAAKLRAASSAVRPLTNPITGIAGCCARAASSQAAAAPPSSVMNPRRFTAHWLPCFPTVRDGPPSGSATAGFSTLYVRFVSLASETIRASRQRMSASLQKRTNGSVLSVSPLCANRRHMHCSKFGALELSPEPVRYRSSPVTALSQAPVAERPIALPPVIQPGSAQRPHFFSFAPKQISTRQPALRRTCTV